MKIKIKIILYILTVIFSISPFILVVLKFLVDLFGIGDNIDLFSSKKVIELQNEIISLQQQKIEEFDQKFKEDNDNGKNMLFISFISFLFFIGTIGYYYLGGNGDGFPSNQSNNPPIMTDTQVKTICDKIDYVGAVIIKLGSMIRLVIDRYKDKDLLNENRLSKAAQDLNSSLYQTVAINRDSIERGEQRVSKLFDDHFLVINQCLLKNNVNLEKILDKLLFILKKMAEYENDSIDCFNEVSETEEFKDQDQDKDKPTSTSSNEKS